MAKWNVYALDVWGNEEDGFDINQFIKVEPVFEDNDREDIITWLYLNELIGEDNPETYEVEDYGETCIWVSLKHNGFPLYMLEKQGLGR